MQANNITDPHNLAQGQEIWIPRTYQIQKGDTLYSLAKKFGVKMESIQAANGIEDPNFIHAGDFIVLPEEANSEDLGLVS
jgi:spore germination protein